MNVIKLCLAVLAAAVFASPAAAFAEDLSRTYALVVANNSSTDPDVAPLQYADDDGARYYELFSSLADETVLLTTLDKESQRIFPKVAAVARPATRATLNESVTALAAKLQADRDKGLQTEVYLVFGGHGNVDESGEGYLSLADGRLTRSELYRDVIRRLNAHYTHLVIDACHAYYMVRSRGGDGWKDDRSGETLDRQLSAYLSGRGDAKGALPPTVGVLLSTAGAAEVHEWSRFRAGVFSHELRSGLLGAADANGDGDVGYTELEAYLVAANAAVTNPRARIRVHARAPSQDRGRRLVRLSDFRNASVLEISPGSPGGRFHVEDARGLRYADLHPDPTAVSAVLLLRSPVDGGGYYLRTDDREARLDSSLPRTRTDELAFAPLDERARGSVQDSLRRNLFATPFGASFVAGYLAGRDSPSLHEAGPPSDVRDAWRTRIGAQYGVASPMLAPDGLQHEAALRVSFAHESGFAVGPFLQWGVTAGTKTFHRFALGVEGRYGWRLGPSLWLGPRARLGNQLVLAKGVDPESDPVGVRGDEAVELQGDPIGVRGELALEAGWELSEEMALIAAAGAGLNVVTEVNREANDETLDSGAFVTLGIDY